MSAKHQLAALLAAGTCAWRMVSGGGHNGFQIIILHHVLDRQIAALHDLLAFVAREHGFLTPGEAEARLNASSNQRDGTSALPCLLTFDDGFASAASVARAVLPHYNAKAIFFVCPGLMDLPHEQQAERVLANVFDGRAPAFNIPSLMNWAQLRELQDDGHVIGAHGSMHLRLSAIGRDAVAREIIAARDRLNEQLGRNPEWYAYAFGDIGSISQPAIELILENFRYCRSGIRGTNGPNETPGILMAQEIDLDARTSYHSAILRSALDLRYVGPRRRIRGYARDARTLR